MPEQIYLNGLYTLDKILKICLELYGYNEIKNYINNIMN